MKIPVMSHQAGPSSSSNPRFFALAGGGVYTATVSLARTPMPIGGVISKLYVTTNPVLTAGSYKIELVVNGSVDANFTATVSSGGSTASDTTHSVNVSAGDLVEWKVTPTGTPDALTGMAVSAVFESNVARSAPLFAAHGSGTGSYFIPPTASSVITTEGFGTGTMAVDGDISYMTIKLTTAPGAGNTRRFTLRQDGADTGLTVDIADTATTGTVSSTVSFTAGQEITISASTFAGTPAASHAGIGLTWNPTTNGYFPLLAVAQTAFATAGTRYIPATGISAGNITTELNAVSVAPSDMTIDMLYAEISTAPTGATKTRTFTLRTDATTDTALTTTITDTQIHNEDTTHSVSPTVGTLLTVSQVPANTPTAIATYNRAGMRGYITPTDSTGRVGLLMMGAG